MINSIIKFVIISAVFLFSVPVFSITFIDVGEFNFPTEVKKGVRVSVFDTKQQRYIAIDYFQNSSSHDRMRHGSLPKKYFDSLTIDYDGNITVPESFDPDTDGCIVRTSVASGRITVGKWIITGNVFRTKKKEIMPGSVIQKELNKFTSPSLKPSFEADFFDNNGKKGEPKTFLQLASSNSWEHNNERRKIGELATEYTMIGYGYTRLIFKDEGGSDHGFDGVFVDDSGDPELFLTESKCRNESEAAKTYLKEEMNEKEIVRKIGEIPSEYIATRNVVQEFIEQHPEKILKFVHRIKPNGKGQCVVVLFDLQEYKHATLPSATEKSDVQWGITTQGVKTSFKSESDYIKGFVASLTEEGREEMKQLLQFMCNS